MDNSVQRRDFSRGSRLYHMTVERCTNMCSSLKMHFLHKARYLFFDSTAETVAAEIQNVLLHIECYEESLYESWLCMRALFVGTSTSETSCSASKTDKNKTDKNTEGKDYYIRIISPICVVWLLK